MAGRLEQSMPIGNEGAGAVIAAGSSAAAQALLGKTVAVLAGAMYSQYATELARNYGMAWGIGGWLVTPFLQKIGNADAQRLKERVALELKTTFASKYSAEVSLAEALSLASIAAYGRRATGEKYLLRPDKDAG